MMILFLILALACVPALAEASPTRLTIYEGPKTMTSSQTAAVSVNGYELRLYSHQTPSSELLTVSSAAYRLSPLNEYGLLTLNWKSPSTQSLCRPGASCRRYRTAR